MTHAPSASRRDVLRAGAALPVLGLANRFTPTGIGTESCDPPDPCGYDGQAGLQ